MIIPIPRELPADFKSSFLEFQLTPLAHALAQKIKLGTSANGRTDAQHFTDCLNGVTLEVVVAAYLQTLGYTVILNDVEVSKEYYFDFTVIINGQPVLVDVKGIFKEDANSWNVTPREMLVINNNANQHIKILYLCFHTKLHDGALPWTFRGAAWQDKVRESKQNNGSKNAGGYIIKSDLKPIEQLFKV